MTSLTNPLRVAIRNEFEPTDIPGGKVDYKRFSSPQSVLRWLETVGAVPTLITAAASSSESWKGLGGQSLADLIATGKPENALKAFNTAKAKLEAPSIPGGRLKPAIAGGTWVIPEYLAGNPLCARVKPRVKKPHKAFRFALQVSASTDQSDLSLVGATIARALWDYVLSGGTATLTMFYVYGYAAKHLARGTKATCLEVNVPFASDSALALALSAAFYRPVLMSLETQILTPLKSDNNPMAFHIKPTGSTLLRGQPAEDFPKLRALGIDCGVAP